MVHEYTKMIMQNRKDFLKLAAGVAAGSAWPALFNPGRIPGLTEEIARFDKPPEEAAADEDFWYQVQQAFTVDRSMVNLNNGGVSPSPAVVQDAMKRHLDYSNKAPTYTMWRILNPQKEGVR